MSISPKNEAQSTATTIAFPSASQSLLISYSTHLSQWHRALSALPEELSSPSPPPSPSSKLRSDKLKLDIEKSVLHGRYVGDICSTRSLRPGYTTTTQPIRHAVTEVFSLEQQSTPWILAETEDEWFRWERKMSEQRSAQASRRDRETLVPPRECSQSSHENVENRNTGMEDSSLAPISLIDSKSRSRKDDGQLDFPVVKRTASVKLDKLKERVPSARLEFPSPAMIELLPSSKIDGQGQVTTHQTNGTNIVSTGDDRVAINATSPTSNAATFPNNQELAQMTSSEHLPHLADISDFPPSFPQCLQTSTPRIVEERPSKPNDAVGVTMEYGNSQRQCTESRIRPELERCHTTTPISPCSSSGRSVSAKIENTSKNTRVMSTGIVSRKGRLTCPLTPPSESIVDTVVTLGKPPKTPERNHSIRRRISPGLHISDEPSTPLSLINGVKIVCGISCPRTPDRLAYDDPLATSRKSLPRPRPPSRKRVTQRSLGDHALDDANDKDVDTEDPSPTKSDRSYFSSPASGESSASTPGSTHRRLGSPTSPLGIFTQHPSQFAPIGESTQSGTHGICAPRTFLASQDFLGPSPQSQQLSEQTGLVRKSSGLLGMAYNSQFDVDARVDHLSNFLEKDIDFDAWVNDADDADANANDIRMDSTTIQI